MNLAKTSGGSGTPLYQHHSVLAKEFIHVALAFDKSYLTPFYVVLTSLFRNNEQYSIHIHAIASGLSREELAEIRYYVESNDGVISFYNVSERETSGLVIPANSHFVVASYYRLFFARLIPAEYKKFIYLDTDVVVNGDLGELYHTDLKGFPAGVVIEKNATRTRPDLGITEEYVYFNSGVMLIDIEEWRAQQVSERSIKYLLENPEKIRFVDQDALNVVLQGNYLSVDPKFNVIHADVPLNLQRKNYASFLGRSVVIHYTLTEHKPWYYMSKSKLRFLYHKYKRLSPHSAEPAYFGFAPKGARMKHLVKFRMREYAINFALFRALFKLAKKLLRK